MRPNPSNTSLNRLSLSNKIKGTQQPRIRKCKNAADLGPRTSISQFKCNVRPVSSMFQPLSTTKAETRPTYGAAVSSASWVRCAAAFPSSWTHVSIRRTTAPTAAITFYAKSRGASSSSIADHRHLIFLIRLSICKKVRQGGMNDLVEMTGYIK